MNETVEEVEIHAASQWIVGSEPPSSTGFLMESMSASKSSMWGSGTRCEDKKEKELMEESESLMEAARSSSSI